MILGATETAETATKEIYHMSSQEYQEKYQQEQYHKALLYQAAMLLKDKLAYIEVTPVDDWCTFTYRIWMADAFAPFFLAFQDQALEFPSYMEAMEAGIMKYNELTENQEL